MVTHPPGHERTAALHARAIRVSQALDGVSGNQLIAPTGRDDGMKPRSQTRMRELHRRGGSRGKHGVGAEDEKRGSRQEVPPERS